ncbi:MAG TPA: helix-turn-helix transcriptional regulator [Candidatus Babeliales bacterium]|jgi:transcriptional regulator with XRE-family HTH domain|nr:helix-turn-helix transcriptional regulator [Candidatus Babeliales bacterium]
MKTGIGERLKSARAAKKLSQKELALLCGWKEGTNVSSRISQYEREEREPTLSDIMIISKALEISPVWLTFGAFEVYSSSNYLTNPLYKINPSLLKKPELEK